jgi:hypothetical protein
MGRWGWGGCAALAGWAWGSGRGAGRGAGELAAAAGPGCGGGRQSLRAGRDGRCAQAGAGAAAAGWCTKARAAGRVARPSSRDAALTRAARDQHVHLAVRYAEHVVCVEGALPRALHGAHREVELPHVEADDGGHYRQPQQLCIARHAAPAAALQPLSAGWQRSMQQLFELPDAGGDCDSTSRGRAGRSCIAGRWAGGAARTLAYALNLPSAGAAAGEQLGAAEQL